MRFVNKYKPLQNQILTVFGVNIISLAHGALLGWISPALPILMSEESPLSSGKVTTEEASWIGSLLSIGALSGNILFSVITSYVGRKWGLVGLAIPNLLAWVCILCGTEIYHIYAARILGGLTGGGLFVILPLFVAEVSDPRIRGLLGSMMSLILSIGILCGYIVGDVLDYHVVPKVMMVLPIVYLLFVLFVPETVDFLMMKSNIESAKKSLRFYKNYNVNKQPDLANYLNDVDLMNRMQQKKVDDNEKYSFIDACRDPTIRRGWAIALFFGVFIQFTGSFPIVNYSATIFKETGSIVDPNKSTIIIGVVQILGVYLSTVTVDKVGRKLLLIVSAAGTALGLFSLGTYSLLHHQGYDMEPVNWIPVTSLSFVIFLVSVGINNLPYIVLTEILPANGRTIACSLCTFMQSTAAAINLKIIPVLLTQIYIYGCMSLYGTCCIVGMVVIWLVIPETKGKVLSELNAGVQTENNDETT